ncbi:MAG: potassium-transporting ATPase subunit KdpB [Planctomycetes bacterium]|nr:potassium-transporting ATPase subunit KdpB [Planctomycetota bacterium]
MSTFRLRAGRKQVHLRAVQDSLRKLHPRVQMRNPVMFVVYVGSFLVTALWIQALAGHGEAPTGYIFGVAAWLWLTVLFANYAEALAEGRGRAQAESLREAREGLEARQLSEPRKGAVEIRVPATRLVKGDHVIVEAGEFVPADGEVVQGVASVDESAVTGESAPVIRESGGDRSAVTGGTKVLSDWLIVKVTSEPGKGFLDRMITLVEAAKRGKTPNEIALSILLAGMTIVFLVVCATLYPMSKYVAGATGLPNPITVTALVALLVCLIPTTIGGLLSAIGIAGMDRLIRANVVAMSGRAVEAAGDVDVLLLDKTGTITLGNRQATEFVPAPGVTPEALADAAQLASLADETPEGRSIVVLAKNKFGFRARDLSEMGAKIVPFTARTRMSGFDWQGKSVRKGAPDSVAEWVKSQGGEVPKECRALAETMSREGCTPLFVAAGPAILGTVRLRDVVKGGMKERFAELRRMGIKTVMITGDNPLTAAAIAAEAGVDDFVAQATPEDKLRVIRKHQADGRMVAMTGDGTNDAPALAQADVAVAMHTGTQAAKEAGNMIDLDSNPTKLLDIVNIGKQLLITRGTMTTFSIANDVAKYFAILPAVFLPLHKNIAMFNIMGLKTPESAILASVIFNALIIVALVPLALRGVQHRPVSAARALRDNILIYGVGGLIAPFVGIKLIDMLLVALHLAGVKS